MSDSRSTTFRLRFRRWRRRRSGEKEHGQQVEQPVLAAKLAAEYVNRGVGDHSEAQSIRNGRVKRIMMSVRTPG